jgi:hypothetical protein
LPPVAFANDQPEMAKHAKLLGDRRLLHADLASKLSHRAGTRGEPAEDPNATRRRERLHRFRDGSRGLGRKERKISIAAVAHHPIIA